MDNEKTSTYIVHTLVRNFKFKSTHVLSYLVLGCHFVAKSTDYLSLHVLSKKHQKWRKEAPTWDAPSRTPSPLFSKTDEEEENEFRKHRITNITSADFLPRNALYPDIARLYTVKIINKQQNSIFLFDTIDFEIKMKTDTEMSEIKGLDEVIPTILHIFENIINVLQNNATSGDRMRFIMRSPSLSYPISTNMLPADDLNLAEVIELEICKVLQSKENFQLHGLIINVLHMYYSTLPAEENS